ncbi:MAG: hypothetical protein RLZZ292_3363 [Bacteroidota bacterium]|jgi:DNA-binding LytR/AlgR family response regulator
MQNKISQSELTDRIKAHNDWLNPNTPTGNPFTATNLDFTGLSFENIHLMGANLVNCNFTHARMRGANLESTNFSESDFSFADLSFSTLKRCDFKHVAINEYTNFLGVDATSMLVDGYNVALMPVEIQSKVQVFDAYSIFLEFKCEDKLQNFMAVELVNIFDEVIRARYGKNKNITTTRKNEYGKFIYTINTTNAEDKEIIEKEKENFALILANKLAINDFAESNFEHEFLHWGLKRLASDFEMVKRIEERGRIELATANNEIIILRQQLISTKELYKNILAENIEALNKRSTPFLPSPKIIFRTELEEKDDYEDIDSDNILYIEKRKDIEDLFLQLEHRNLFIKNKISDVEDQLLRNPTFIIGNKGLLVNVKKVKKYAPTGNNLLAHFEEKNGRYVIVISQTRKEKFKELFKELNKKQ